MMMKWKEVSQVETNQSVDKNKAIFGLTLSFIKIIISIVIKAA